jgi:hypothetical protein
MQKIISLVSSGLDENKRRAQYISKQANPVPDTIKKKTYLSSPSGGSVHTITMPRAHSHRHSALPFSKTRGHARLHGIAVWVGRKTRKQY